MFGRGATWASLPRREGGSNTNLTWPVEAPLAPEVALYIVLLELAVVGGAASTSQVSFEPCVTVSPDFMLRFRNWLAGCPDFTVCFRNWLARLKSLISMARCTTVLDVITN